MADTENSRKKDILTLLIIAAVVILLAVLFNIYIGGKFLTIVNINSICTNAVMASFMAWALCFVFALGYMDLSIGAAMILCVYAAGELGNRLGIPGVLIGGITLGVILMLINYCIFAWAKIPSWIAGLGMMMLYESVAALYTYILNEQSKVVVTLEEQYRSLGRAPWIYVLLIVGVVFTYIIYNKTSLGMNVRALGGNPAVAKTMGINRSKTLILTGIVCGVLVGCSGFIRESYAARVFAMTGLQTLNVNFQPIATVLLAQVLQKRINIIIAVPFCALFIYMVFNILTMLNVPSGTLQDLILGVLVVIFGIVAQRNVKGVVK